MNETAYQGQYGQTPEDALRQARAELEERDEQLGILHAVMQTVSSSFDLPTMLNNASQAASHIFRGASIFVGLINAAETEISIFSNFSAKTDDPEIAGMRFPLTHGSQLGDMLFRKQIPVMIPDAETDPIFAHQWPLVRQYAPKTLLLIPLVHHNVLGIFGIYTMQARRNFTLFSYKFRSNCLNIKRHSLPGRRMINRRSSRSSRRDSASRKNTLTAWTRFRRNCSTRSRMRP